MHRIQHTSYFLDGERRLVDVVPSCQAAFGRVVVSNTTKGPWANAWKDLLGEEEDFFSFAKS